MSELKTCVNCGHRVSSTVEQCPGCGSIYLFGSICNICKGASSEKDGIEWPTRYGSRPTTLYHRACAESVLLDFRPNCYVCGADLRVRGGDRIAALLRRPYQGEYGKADPCPSCAERRPFGYFTS